jgi:hypothetical protein
MTRTIPAIATALLIAPALFATAAQACISCNYVPEVVKHSSTTYEARQHTRERSYTAEHDAPRRAKRIVREAIAKAAVEADEPAPRKQQAQIETKIETKTESKTENSSISSAAKAAAIETPKTEPKLARGENSSISLASTEIAAAENAPVAETAKEVSAKPVDCKKFFPSVGMTVTVPCE